MILVLEDEGWIDDKKAAYHSSGALPFDTVQIRGIVKKFLLGLDTHRLEIHYDGKIS